MRSLLQQKPVILTLVYFNCPMMCTLVLNGLVKSMQKMPLVLGKDYTVITLSIDERKSRRSPRPRKYSIRTDIIVRELNRAGPF